MNPFDEQDPFTSPDGLHNFLINGMHCDSAIQDMFSFGRNSASPSVSPNKRRRCDVRETQGASEAFRPSDDLFHANQLPSPTFQTSLSPTYAGERICDPYTAGHARQPSSKAQCEHCFRCRFCAMELPPNCVLLAVGNNAAPSDFAGHAGLVKEELADVPLNEVPVEAACGVDSLAGDTAAFPLQWNNPTRQLSPRPYSLDGSASPSQDQKSLSTWLDGDNSNHQPAHYLQRAQLDSQSLEQQIEEFKSQLRSYASNCLSVGAVSATQSCNDSQKVLDNSQTLDMDNDFDWNHVDSMNRSEYIKTVSFLRYGEYVHVKKNVVKIDVRLSEECKIVRAKAIAIPYRRTETLAQLVFCDDNMWFQNSFDFKVGPPTGRTNFWCLKLSSTESMNVFKEFSSETPVKIILALQLLTPGNNMCWETTALEPFCTVTHIRYTPQALFGFGFNHQEMRYDADIIPFVFDTLVTSKTLNKPRLRPLFESDIEFLRSGIIGPSYRPNVHVVNMVAGKKFDKLNASNEWLSKLSDLFAIEEVHQLWENGRVDGFLTLNMVGSILELSPERKIVHFNEDRKCPSSVVVSGLSNHRICQIVISIEKERKKAKHCDHVITYSITDHSKRAMFETLQDAIRCALDAISRN